MAAPVAAPLPPPQRRPATTRRGPRRRPRRPRSSRAGATAAASGGRCRVDWRGCADGCCRGRRGCGCCSCCGGGGDPALRDGCRVAAPGDAPRLLLCRVCRGGLAACCCGGEWPCRGRGRGGRSAWRCRTVCVGVGLGVTVFGSVCVRRARRARPGVPSAATHVFTPFHRCKGGGGGDPPSLAGVGVSGARGGGGEGRVGGVQSGGRHPSAAQTWRRRGSGGRPSPPPAAPPRTDAGAASVTWPPPAAVAGAAQLQGPPRAPPPPAPPPHWDLVRAGKYAFCALPTASIDVFSERKRRPAFLLRPHLDDDGSVAPARELELADVSPRGGVAMASYVLGANRRNGSRRVSGAPLHGACWAQTRPALVQSAI